MAEPTPEELGPLLPAGESGALDEETGDPYEGENSAFMAAAKAAVGSDAAATALKDAITECLREHGLISDVAEDEAEEADTDVGAGFPDF